MSLTGLSNNLALLQWAPKDTETSLFDPVAEAYDKALDYLEANLDHGEFTNIKLDKNASIDEMLRTLQTAKKLYDEKPKSKALKWLKRLSRRVSYYSSVLDVIASIHPESAALVWAAMKFVVMGVMNHEEVLQELAKALCNIAEYLPHAELKVRLYPSPEMIEHLSFLYTQLIVFIERTIAWYNQKRSLRRVVSNITKPHSLRFKDLLDTMTEASRRVDALALTMSFIEQRRILEAVVRLQHLLETKVTGSSMNEYKNLTNRIQDLAVKIDASHTLQNASLLDTNGMVRDLQIAQIFASADTIPLPSPDETRRFYAFMRRRHLRTNSAGGIGIQEERALHNWGSKKSSSIISITTNIRTRYQLHDFATDAINLISQAQVPIVWALPPKNNKLGTYCAVDVLKQLVSQIAQRNPNLMNERSLALTASRFKSAKTVTECLDMLKASLVGLAQLYIIIDLKTLLGEYDEAIDWPDAFFGLFKELKDHQQGTIVRIALLGGNKIVGSGRPASISGTIQIKGKNSHKPRGGKKRNVASHVKIVK